MEEKLQESLKEESLFNITLEAFDAILKNGLTLDQLFILEQYNKGIDVLATIPGSRTLGWRLTLIRKGYLGEDDVVSPSGKMVLGTTKIVEALAERKEVVKKTKEKVKTDFDKWWSVYPVSDGFTHKGKTFPPTRKMNIEKEKCKQLFNNMVLNKEFTAEEIIQGTETHIRNKKDQSVMKGENQLQYVTNSERYLRLKVFSAFIRNEKASVIKLKPATGAVDI